jgi:C1A family cysteine protease
MPRKIARYGWKPQLPDKRDYRFVPDQKFSAPAALPTSTDLRPLMPAVYDQGDLGSCTANALAGAFEYEMSRNGIAPFIPSRLFIYYNERVIEGTVDYDAGADLRDGMSTLANLGVCPETDWPYDISQFTVKPSAADYSAALANKAIAYFAVPQDEFHIKAAIASGYPVVYGFSVYSSFESDQVATTGEVPMPQPGEQVIGGHAVVAVGYNPDGHVIVRNSWGTGWGMAGYFAVPFAYLIDPDLASDFWIMKRVS